MKHTLPFALSTGNSWRTNRSFLDWYTFMLMNAVKLEWGNIYVISSWLCSAKWRYCQWYRNPTRINFCYLVTPNFRGEIRTFFTNKSAPKKNQWTTNCPKNLHVKNEVVSWPRSSSKIIVLVAQLIFTDGGPPLTFFHLHQAVSWWERGRAWDFYLAHRLENHLKTSVFSHLLKD